MILVDFRINLTSLRDHDRMSSESVDALEMSLVERLEAVVAEVAAQHEVGLSLAEL